MNRAIRIALYGCIMLALGVFVGCSDDDTASPAQPQPEPNPTMAGSIGVYTDAAGTDRDVIDTGGVVTLYVVHKIPNGGTASAFSIDAPEGWSLIGTDHQIELHLGDFDTGIAYAYGECMTGTIHLATLTYQSPGNSPSGATFNITPYTNWDFIRVIDCAEHTLDDGMGLTSPVSQP
jgi:hypothetical protein